MKNLFFYRPSRKKEHKSFHPVAYFFTLPKYTGNFGKVSAATIFVLEMTASVTLTDQC
jgi:hypothetical protein